MGVRYSVVLGVASEPRRRQPAAGVSNPDPTPPALPARRRLEPSPAPGGDGARLGLAAGAPAAAGALLNGLLGTGGGVYPGEGAPAGSPAYPCCGGLAGAGSASELYARSIASCERAGQGQLTGSAALCTHRKQPRRLGTSVPGMQAQCSNTALVLAPCIPTTA